MTEEELETPEEQEEDVRALAEEQGLDDDMLKEMFGDDPAPEPKSEEDDPASSVSEEAEPEAPAEESSEDSPAAEAPAITREEYDSLVRARDGLIGEKNAIRKELAELKGTLSEQPKAAQPETQEELSEFDSLLRDVKEAKEAALGVQQQLQQEREVANLRSEIQQAASYRQEYEQKFAEKVPSYQEDLATARQALHQQLVHQGVAPDDATKQLLVEEAKFTLQARAANIDPAEALYKFMTERGLVQAKGNAGAEPEAPAPIAPPKAKKRSLSAVGGSPPVGGNSAQEWYDNASPEEIAALAEDPDKFNALIEKMEGVA